MISKNIIVDTKHIDSTQKALEVGIDLVRHLQPPFDKETSEKLTDIADTLNLLATFVIEQARYTRFLLIREQQKG